MRDEVTEYDQATCPAGVSYRSVGTRARPRWELATCSRTIWELRAWLISTWKQENHKLVKMIIVPGKGSCRILSVREGGEVKKICKGRGVQFHPCGKVPQHSIVMNGLSWEGRRMKMAQTLRQSTRQWLPNSSTWGNPAPRLRGLFPYSITGWFLDVLASLVRCASISWFQVVSQSVIDVFRLAHLRVFVQVEIFV